MQSIVAEAIQNTVLTVVAPHGHDWKKLPNCFSTVRIFVMARSFVLHVLVVILVQSCCEKLKNLLWVAGLIVAIASKQCRRKVRWSSVASVRKVHTAKRFIFTVSRCIHKWPECSKKNETRLGSRYRYIGSILHPAFCSVSSWNLPRHGCFLGPVL